MSSLPAVENQLPNEVGEPNGDIEESKQLTANPPSPSKDWRFWLIFLALCVTTLLVALDVSIIFIALPTIANDLGSEELFVWIANSYLLAATIAQPVVGNASNIFGRRSLTILSVLLFMLGSGLAGGAHSTAMIIAGRSIQGVGGGGIITLGEIIVCDLVSLSERGQYIGLLAGTYAIGTTIGPIIGGVFTQHVTWRWIFYINLPIAGVALALIIPFMSLQYRREGTVWDRLKRVDWFGSALLAASVTSILLALAYAGTKHPWSSWNAIVPLVVGFLGLAGFAISQRAGYVEELVMPPRLFSNRTSNSIFVMAFVHGLLLSYVTIFLPVYFQAVLGSSPTRSGVQVIPTALTLATAAAATGAIITHTGEYRSHHFIGWALMSAGCGAFASLDVASSTGAWVGFQLLFGIGCGMVINSMIPPLLASLPTSEVATAAATWTFMRSFGSIWGVAIPSTVFNERINLLVASRLTDFPTIASLLVNGGAYEKATRAFVQSIPSEQVMVTVVNIYVDALKIVWYVSIPFAVLGFPIALFVKKYHLTTELDTEFGIAQRPIDGTKEKITA